MLVLCWFNPNSCWFKRHIVFCFMPNSCSTKLAKCSSSFNPNNLVGLPSGNQTRFAGFSLPLSSMIFPSIDLRMTCVYRGYSMMFHIFLRCSYNFPIVVPWFSQQPPSGLGMSIDGRTTLQRRSRMAFPCGCTQPVAGRLGHWGKFNRTISENTLGKRMKKCDLPLGCLVDSISYRAVDQNLLVCSSHR